MHGFVVVFSEEKLRKTIFSNDTVSCGLVKTIPIIQEKFSFDKYGKFPNCLLGHMSSKMLRDNKFP
jgi:hypothetical protein